MNRRKVVRGGLGLLTLGAFGPSWGARLCDPTFDGEPESSCGTPVPGGGPRAIESLASQMSSNTWSQLPVSNFTSLSRNDQPNNPPRSILEYTHNLFWNETAKELHIRGGGATGSSPYSYQQRHLRYREASGEWDPVTDWHTGWAHQWGHFCGDPRTGDLYYRRRTTTEIYKWSYEPYPATVSSWSLFDSGSFNGGVNANALGYFPDLNGGQGGLVFFSTAGDYDTISATDETLRNWSQLGSGVLNAEVTVEGIIAYLPGQQWLLYGGGKGQWSSSSWPRNRSLAKVEPDGTVTKLNDTPFDFGANGDGKIVAHPNRRVFGIDTNGLNLYEYNEGADSWSTEGLAPLPSAISAVHWSAAVMIPEFNVIYYIAQLGTAGSADVQEWLYKL